MEFDTTSPVCFNSSGDLGFLNAPSPHSLQAPVSLCAKLLSENIAMLLTWTPIWGK